MNCPKCDSPSLPAQKFCRTCGTSLQIITKPLAEAGELEKPPKITSQWMRNLMLGGFVTMFLGLFYAVIGGIIIQEKIVTGIGILVFILGMFLLGFGDLWRRTRPKSAPNPQPEITSQPTVYLPEDTTNPASITERTTSLLNYPITTNPKQPSGELGS